MLEYKSMSLANQIYDELEHRILTGEYAPGEVISEKRLVAELNVSRTPIREALSRLNQERLIKDTPAGNEVVGVSRQDAYDMFLVKRQLENIAVRRAAENITDEELEQLQMIYDKQEFYAQRRDYKTVLGLDNEFHEAIYKASRSITLETILEGVHRKMFKYRMNSIEHENRVDASVAEHKAILEAIKAHNGDAAEAALYVHVENACEYFVGGEK